MVWVIVAIAFIHLGGDAAPTALMSRQVHRRYLPQVNAELVNFYGGLVEYDKGVMFTSGIANNQAEARMRLRQLVEMGFLPAGREVPEAIRRIWAPHQAF